MHHCACGDVHAQAAASMQLKEQLVCATAIVAGQDIFSKTSVAKFVEQFCDGRPPTLIRQSLKLRLKDAS